MSEPQAEEQLRPYRRLVRILFFIAVILGVGLIFRGVIFNLDQMPTSGLPKASTVNKNTLRLCANQLQDLERRIRAQAALALTAPPPAKSRWAEQVEGFEKRRLRIIARCRLDEASEDPVRLRLKEGAQTLSAELRAYTRLEQRFQEEVLPRMTELEEQLGAH